ncbi:MAG: putative porin [bacterium]|nr:putative porin [bacterium]
MKRIIGFAVLVSSIIATMPTPGSADEPVLRFSGDLRGRWETFRFSEDETGSKKDRRARIRYRLRLDMRARLNTRAAVKIRLGTGDTDTRSGNQTIGSPVDFGPNEIDVRRAYLVFTPFENGKLPNRDGHWAFQFGKVANPFVWKHSKDVLLWDHDINPGGISTTFDLAFADGASVLYVNAAGFVISETSSGSKDPYMAVAQVALKQNLGSRFKAGIRGTWYNLGDLDSLFIVRGAVGKAGDSTAVTTGGGNIPDGLTGDVNGGSMNVIETTLYVTMPGTWPVTVFGGYSTNLDAQASQLTTAGEDNVGYNIGAEVGDEKKNVLVGGGYYYLEANAFPSQFIDSDVLDGFTNRKGFLAYLSRQIMSRTTFALTFLHSDAIETTLPDYGPSVKDSERFRTQVDLVYAF